MAPTFIIQTRIREAKEELTAEIRINTERVNQLTVLLRERQQYEQELDARQKNVVSVNNRYYSSGKVKLC